MSIDIYDFISPNKLKHLTIKGRIRNILINLTACKVATAAPTPYSDPTRLIPQMPPGVAPRIFVITFILNNLFVHNPIVNPVITKAKVIKMAGLHKLWRITNDSLVNVVPIIVRILIFNIFLVPIGHSAISNFPLLLIMLAPIKAKAPKIPPATR